MPNLGWRYLLLIAAVPLLIFFFACFVSDSDLVLTIIIWHMLKLFYLVNMCRYNFIIVYLTVVDYRCSVVAGESAVRHCSESAGEGNGNSGTHRQGQRETDAAWQTRRGPQRGSEQFCRSTGAVPDLFSKTELARLRSPLIYYL